MCEHNTTIVKYDQGNVQVEVCTWGCGQTLIAVKDASGLTHTFTHAELAALREEVERLRKFFNEMEWSGDPNINICPDCGNKKAQGHRPSCRYRVFRGE